MPIHEVKQTFRFGFRPHFVRIVEGKASSAIVGGRRTAKCVISTGTGVVDGGTNEIP